MTAPPTARHLDWLDWLTRRRTQRLADRYTDGGPAVPHGGRGKRRRAVAAARRARRANR